MAYHNYQTSSATLQYKETLLRSNYKNLLVFTKEKEENEGSLDY